MLPHEQVKADREAAQLTQTEAAKIVEVTLRTWQRWESGKNTMSLQMRQIFQARTGLGPPITQVVE